MCSDGAVASQEKFATLLEEATFLKRHSQQLERENKRLQAASAYTRKSKRQLSTQARLPTHSSPHPSLLSSVCLAGSGP